MRLFRLEGGRLEEAKAAGGKKAAETEKIIQTMIENNLPTVFPGLEFLSSEWQVDGLRPDSVAFDGERGSFAIIEYKNVRDTGVIDQGMSYYQLMQERRERFVLLYQKATGRALDAEGEVNWDEARVIFVSPEFTEHQRRASQSVALPIELYEISVYGGGLVALDRVGGAAAAPAGGGRAAPRVRLAEYSEEDFLGGKYYSAAASEQTRELYFDLKNRILEALPGTEARQRKMYMGIYSTITGSAICAIIVQKDALRVFYCASPEDAAPSGDFLEDYTGKNHIGPGNYVSAIRDGRGVDEAMRLIERVYASRGS